jgi:probable HAF family extracellular repeat protein
MRLFFGRRMHMFGHKRFETWTMPRRVPNLRWLSLAILPLITASSRAGVAPTSYTLTSLGTIPGPGYTGDSGTTAINDNGQIVGAVQLAGGLNTDPMLYGNVGMQDLGTLGGPGGQAFGINNSDQIVGYASDLPGQRDATKAFLFTNGAMHRLSLDTFESSAAYAINASGQVVGEEGYVAFMYSNGNMHLLGTLGGTTSVAYGINSAGDVVGYSYLLGNIAPHAFFYSNGSMQDLGTLGGIYSQANAINDKGEVVGESDVPGQKPYNGQAFLYNNGVMQDLGTLGGDTSTATAINDSGVIVGESEVSGTNSHAFVYENGSMYDLNSLIVNPQGDAVYLAEGINNAGQIVGVATLPSGQFQAVLLTPTATPLPSAMAACLSAVPLVLLGKQLRRLVNPKCR